MKGISILALSLFSSISFAKCSNDHCNDVYVDTIKASSEGDILFSTSGDESRMYCDPIQNNMVKLRRKSLGFPEMYALLVSAQKSESTISFIIDDQEYDCDATEITANQ